MTDGAIFQVVVTALLAVMVLLNGLYLNNQNKQTKAFKDFVDEVRPYMRRLDTLEAQHKIITEDGGHKKHSE